MSDSEFITQENQTSSHSAWEGNRRLFASLPLFLKLLPLSIILILLSSAAPAVFRWYSGQLSNSAPGFTLAQLWVLTGAAILARIFAWVTFELSGMWDSQHIHRQMVTSLANTRTTYFDENPSGRLINRLISDFNQVRSTAIIFIGDLLNASIEVLAIGIVAAFAHPLASLFILPLFFIFFYIQRHRSVMMSHARFLSAIGTSQILARQSDLIEGREIFLLYGKSELLLKRMKQSLRTYLQASVLGAQIEAWGSFWIRFAAEGFSFIVLIFIAFAIHHQKIDVTLAGVIISSLFGITASIGWLDFATAFVARSLPHIDRVFEIVDLPHEEKEESKTPRTGTPLAAPQFSKTPDLVFKNYTMSYRSDSPVILNELNLTIEAGKRTALIGRTGSGKTSLTQALLRMVYVHAGEIVFREGEKETSLFDYPVRELRKLFGVIPQSPYLFAGTLRDNLDLTQTIEASKLSAALEAVGLKLSLDHAILEGGQNLSQGERQLVCLARVIAADKPFIMMDEATSGLDPETDARITHLLKHELAGKTVITIAHRTETIQHYDRVIELAHGQLVSSTTR